MIDQETKTPVQALGLRERKTARAKLALLDAVMERLGDRSLESIPVKDLCIAAEVSEPSFFNYFPKKTDLLVYFIQLWSVDMGWRLSLRKAGSTARSAVEDLFVETARQMDASPGLMAEILAFQAKNGQCPYIQPLELAEKILRFPDRQGIERISESLITELFGPLVAEALRRGELPSSLDPNAVLFGLGAIFFGLPAIAGAFGPAGLGRAYLAQIDLLWRGLVAHGGLATRR
jgi:AcrR family transcriptional regulator